MKKMFGRGISLILALVMLCSVVPLMASAEIVPAEKTLLLASEDFSDCEFTWNDHLWSDGTNWYPGYENKLFYNHPNAGDNTVNGGYGWNSKWLTDGKEEFGSGSNLELSNLGDTSFAWSYYAGASRELANTVSLDEDGTYYIQFDAFSNDWLRHTGIYFGDLFFGMGTGAADIDDGTNDRNPKQPFIGKRSWSAPEQLAVSERVIETANKTYTYKLKLNVNANGVDTANLKAWASGGVTNTAPEPDEWEFSEDVEVEVGSGIVDYLYFAFFGVSYMSNIKLIKVLETNVKEVDVAGNFTEVASETWNDYRVENENQEMVFPDGISLRDYNGSVIDGGSGWIGKWSPNYDDFTADFTTNTPNFAGSFNNSLMFWPESGGGFVARQLATPISLTEASDIDIAFGVTMQSAEIGLLTLDNNKSLKIGFRTPDWSTLSAVIMKNDTVLAELPNIFATTSDTPMYNCLARIHVVPNAKSQIYFKFYPVGGEEPLNWMLSAEYEFSAAEISKIGLEVHAWGAYLGDVSVSKRYSPFTARVGSANGKANVYVELPGTVPAADINNTNITATGASYTISPVYATTPIGGVKQANGVIVSFDNDGLSPVTATITLDILALDISNYTFDVALPEIDLAVVTLPEQALKLDENDDLFISFNIKGSNTKGGDTATILMGIYDVNNALIGIKHHNKTQYEENPKIIITEYLEDFEYARLFVWDDSITLAPIIDIPITVQQ